jgi:hypothetical protein
MHEMDGSLKLSRGVPMTAERRLPEMDSRRAEPTGKEQQAIRQEMRIVFVRLRGTLFRSGAGCSSVPSHKRFLFNQTEFSTLAIQ